MTGPAPFLPVLGLEHNEIEGQRRWFSKSAYVKSGTVWTLEVPQPVSSLPVPPPPRDRICRARIEKIPPSDGVYADAWGWRVWWDLCATPDDLRRKWLYFHSTFESARQFVASVFAGP